MHMVMTVLPTLAHGGNFYSHHHLNCTLHGLRLNHFHGPMFTNTKHTTSMVTIHRMILYTYEQCLHLGPRATQEDKPYSPESWAILIVLTGWEPGLEMLFRDQGGQYQHQTTQKAAQKLMDWTEVEEPLGELKDLVKGWKDYWASHAV